MQSAQSCTANFIANIILLGAHYHMCTDVHTLGFLDGIVLQHGDFRDSTKSYDLTCQDVRGAQC